MLGAVVIGALLSGAPEYRALPLLFAGFQIAMLLNGVHRRLCEAGLRDLAVRCGLSIAEAALAGLVASALVPLLRSAYPASVAAGIVSALVLVALAPLVPRLVKERWLSEGVLILGSGRVASELESALTRGAHDLPGSEPAPRERLTLTSAELKAWASGQGYSRIVLTEPPDGDSRSLAAALIECKAAGIHVEQAVDSYGKLQSKVWLDGLHPQWLVYAPSFLASRSYLRFKRAFDLVLVSVLGVLLMPVVAAVAALIRLESPGPILFWQERVGLNGERFWLAKFRSMREDAELHSGPTWSRVGDPRITRVGRFIRKFRLDELPQMVNVLSGEMSFIGPRPERPAFVERLSSHIPYYEIRHSVKPGISGWAQVKYPYGSSIEDAYEKLQYDLFYIQNLSLGLDIEIFLRTFKVVLSGSGR